MRRRNPRALLSNRLYFIRGVTFIELLVTLVILSILAAVALPYAEITVRRNKEIELRQALREIRTSIDRFHADWEAARISKLDDAVSEDGYPKTLRVLVDGVASTQALSGRVKYLRRIPSDPFTDSGKSSVDHWAPRGYQDPSDTISWGGRDVYDIRSRSALKSIDGSYYRDW